MEAKDKSIIAGDIQPVNEITVSGHDPLMDMMSIAVQAEGGIEKMQQLMVMQERYEANNARKAFNSAMSRFQSLLPAIEKLGVVDFTTGKGRTYYRYALIEDIAKAIQPALKETGLSYRFKQTQESGLIKVTCIVTHREGHSDSSELSSSPDVSGGKDTLKSIASAISYLRRYTLTGILGVVVGGEDDESPEGEAPKAETTTNCYPDEEFKKNFPAWSKIVLSGKKTVDELHAYLTKKNILISESQYKELQGIGK